MDIPTAPSQRKRVHFSYSDDSDADEAPKAKKARFPKRKKDGQQGENGGKILGTIEGEEDAGPILLSTDPRVAALERATRRDRAVEQLLEEDTSVPNDVVGAEEDYEGEDEERVEDGMRIEPFNLKQEREEGYFDAEGNYVEYRNDNVTKDAWLESVEVDTRFAGKALSQSREDSGGDKDLSKDEIGGIKRRIADVLESGETVLQALRRLRGTTRQGNKNERMSGPTKLLFDQLTEDAMKLLDNGDYNVYEEEKEVFQREAEGYEALARLRSGGSNHASSSAGVSSRSNSSSHLDIDLRTSNGKEELDIFGGDDEDDTTVDIFSNTTWDSVDNGEQVHASTEPDPSAIAKEAMPAEGSGYVYDDVSGYYYNSDVGYYYDANSGLYCSASTGQWYHFNEGQNSYEQVT